MAAVQHAATLAREPESETNIPPLMMQEMTWKHGRRQVAQSHEDISRGLNRKPLFTRLSSLRKGGLEKESELRPARPNEAQVSFAPGSFFRGFEDPINSDSVTVSGPATTYRGSPSPTNTPAPSWSPSTETYSDDQKRDAIRQAQAAYRSQRQ
jgi:hypothetical protein